MGPPRETDVRKPERWRERESVRRRVEGGSEVRPRRAREAFWRWEQAWERLTRDIVKELRRS